MEKDKKNIYEIYINNEQFSCLFEDIKYEKNIPINIGIPDLILVKKETNDKTIKIYYDIKNLVNTQMILNENIILEKLFPLSIPLNRLRDLLSPKLNKSFLFSFNSSKIQIQEEHFFSLENIIKEGKVFLCENNFAFGELKEKYQKKKENNKESPFTKEEPINGNCSNQIKEKDNDILTSEELSKELIEEEEVNEEISQKKEKSGNNAERPKKEQRELEYELLNNENKVGKIKVYPGISLTELREQIIKLIPKRTQFLNKETKIDPSQEDNITVEEISENNKINLSYPVEDLTDSMELEIFLNGKFYIKKEFYLHIKLKSLRINLKFDETCKLIYKGEILPIEEESKMTLNELCYKELKVFYVRIKEESNCEDIKIKINNSQKNNSGNLEKKKYPNLVIRSNDNCDNWIIFGKEKSGKTTFINCLCNYLNDVKFENNFRYSLEAKKKKGYEIYEFQGNLIQQKVRAIEFPGFSGDLEEDKQIKDNIKKYIKTLKDAKLICFVISGNETRLTEDLKSIFSNVTNIFALDIRKNFVFIITNCDAKQPPVIDSIKGSFFPKFLPKDIDSWIFKFNNSFLFESNRKEFWNIGVSSFDALMNAYNKRDTLTLNITKSYMDFDFDSNSNNFIISLIKLNNYKYYLNIIKNINSYDKSSNIEIPFDFTEIYKICTNCNKTFMHGQCYYCKNTKYKENKYQRNNISLQNLKNHQKLYSDCLNKYKTFYKDHLITSAMLYKTFTDYYNSKLIQNSSLKKDLNEIVENNYKKDKKLLNQEIIIQENLYKEYITSKFNDEYRNFILLKLNID